MEIRDTRNGSWYWVNVAVNACTHISHADKSVYGAIASLGGCKEIHPSYEEIAKRSATSTRQSKRAIKRLTGAGYLSVEKGGGKGNANVYVLLKVPKGCKMCIVSNGDNLSPFANGDKNDTQTVTKTTANGDKLSPQIDNELDNELYNISEQSSRDVSDVIDSFKDINPSYRKFFPNKTQRKAVASLLNVHGKERVLHVISFLSKSNKLPYFPTITTPQQLEDKWAALEAAVVRKQSEQKTEQNKYKIAF